MLNERLTEYAMRQVLFAAAIAAMPLAIRADPPSAPGPDLGPPISAAQFDAYSEGKTLFYAESGQVWGSEHYMPNHQVMWAFTGQDCEYGQWYDDHGAICFVYEGNPNPNCWHFYLGSTGLVAKFLSGSSLLSEVGQTSEPMQCAGPQVGA